LIDKELSTKLQLQNDLYLTKAISILRQNEEIKQEIAKQVQVDAISFRQRCNLSSTTTPSHHSRQHRHLHTREVRGQSNYHHNTSSSSINTQTSNHHHVVNCNNCSSSHKRKQCPAYGKQCHYCKKQNHFSKVCKTRKMA